MDSTSSAAPWPLPHQGPHKTRAFEETFDFLSPKSTEPLRSPFLDGMPPPRNPWTEQGTGQMIGQRERAEDMTREDSGHDRPEQGRTGLGQDSEGDRTRDRTRDRTGQRGGRDRDRVDRTGDRTGDGTGDKTWDKTMALML